MKPTSVSGAGLTRQQAERINAELEHEGKTEFVGGVGPDGPITCFTREGLNSIERHLYERSKPEVGRQDDQSELGVSYEQAEAASREFIDLASDLMSSDSGTVIENFNHLYEFIEEDAVMRLVTADLRNHPAVDIDNWLAHFEASGGSAIGSHSYKLPRDKTAQGATILQLYRKIYNDNISVRPRSPETLMEQRSMTDAFLSATRISPKTCGFSDSGWKFLVNETANRTIVEEEQSAMATDRMSSSTAMMSWPSSGCPIIEKLSA